MMNMMGAPGRFITDERQSTLKKNYIIKKGMKEIPVILIALLFIVSCSQGYSPEQKTHIAIFRQLTRLDFPSGSAILASGYTKFLDHTFYMVVPIDTDYLNRIMKAQPPFSDTWSNGPVPEEYRYGLYFGKGLNIKSFGKGKTYGDSKLVRMLDSDQLVYSATGPLLNKPHELNVVIIDRKEMLLYAGSYSM